MRIIINNYEVSLGFSLGAFGLAVFYLPGRSFAFLFGFFMFNVLNIAGAIKDLIKMKTELEEQIKLKEES